MFFLLDLLDLDDFLLDLLDFLLDFFDFLLDLLDFFFFLLLRLLLLDLLFLPFFFVLPFFSSLKTRDCLLRCRFVSKRTSNYFTATLAFFSSLSYSGCRRLFARENRGKRSRRSKMIHTDVLLLFITRTLFETDFCAKIVAKLTHLSSSSSKSMQRGTPSPVSFTTFSLLCT